jgi:hypothetical protein
MTADIKDRNVDPGPPDFKDTRSASGMCRRNELTLTLSLLTTVYHLNCSGKCVYHLL